MNFYTKKEFFSNLILSHSPTTTRNQPKKGILSITIFFQSHNFFFHFRRPKEENRSRLAAPFRFFLFSFFFVCVCVCNHNRFDYLYLLASARTMTRNRLTFHTKGGAKRRSHPKSGTVFWLHSIELFFYWRQFNEYQLACRLLWSRLISFEIG